MGKAKTFASIIESVKRQEATLRLCLRGDLVAEHERLCARLDDIARDQFVPTSLADVDPAIELATKITALEAKMAAEMVEFGFAALRRRDFEALIEANPAREGTEERWNGETFPVALVAACATSPTMTVAEVEQLCEVLTQGQWNAVCVTAFEVNQGGTGVPFSERASAVMRVRASS